MFSVGYNQIQSWPTPQLWVGQDHGPREVQDAVSAGQLLLTAVSIPTPQINSSVTDNGNGSIALTLVLFNGPITQNETDNARFSISLASVIIPAPLNDSENDDGNGSIAIVSIMIPAPLNGSATDIANGRIQLNSVSI